jgi:hypothetical protein
MAAEPDFAAVEAKLAPLEMLATDTLCSAAVSATSP